MNNPYPIITEPFTINLIVTMRIEKKEPINE